MTEPYIYHYLIPEKQWAVFYNGEFIAMFDTPEEAKIYCIQRNDKEQ